ncbi:unnamed protein product [Bursaphelenchus okinawaensis]|uniref:Ribosome receptor lysine/proline rich domain-containing protein n=1 Tax=Bursaphelenchus okinawaensis TaxID=465554 RepID=A0A811LBN5_9BILA|nr:unnamed protein product [Bursaphelenchus okinawaensis]CAG9119992.1 unnamed protein product [Bursaphelenchus okinawaensis]
MVDPVFLGLIGLGVVLSVICFFILKMAPKEKSFEEAYGKNAMKLLSEENNKSKQKPKNKKSKEKKEPEEKKPEPAEKPKPDSKFEVKDKKPEEKVEQKIVKPVEQKDDNEPKAPKKKNKADSELKKAESKKNDNVTEQVQVKSASLQNSSPPKPKTKKAGPLNFDRLLNRLAELDLESEVVEFIKKLNEQVQSAEKKNKEDQKFKKELTDKEREIDRLQDILETSHTEIAKVKSLEEALAESNGKYQSVELSLKNKLTEHRQLTEKVAYLQKQLALSASKASQSDQLAQEHEKIKNEFNQKMSQLVIDAKKDESKVKELIAERDGLHKQLEELKLSAGAVEKVAQLEKEINEAKETVQRSLDELKESNEKYQTIDQSLKAKLREEQQWMEKVVSLQKQLAESETIVAKANQLNKENEQLKNEFNQKINKLADDLTLYETENKNLKTEKDQLQSKVTELQQPKEAPKETSSEDAERIKQLEQELEDQKRRNKELRERNYKLFDLAKEKEESVRSVKPSQSGSVKEEKSNDAEELVKSLAKACGLSSPSDFNSQSIEKWFKQAISDITSKHEQQPANGTSSQDVHALEEEIKKLKKDAEHYQVAINVAYEQLEHAAKLADDIQNKHHHPHHHDHHHSHHDRPHHDNHHNEKSQNLSQRRNSVPSQCSEEWEVVG